MSDTERPPDPAPASTSAPGDGAPAGGVSAAGGFLVDDGLDLPPPPPPESPSGNGDEEKVMSLVEHLTELRYRLIASIVAIALCSCATLYFALYALPVFARIIDLLGVFVLQNY